jgi:chorismate-pyruvate lyase
MSIDERTRPAPAQPLPVASPPSPARWIALDHFALQADRPSRFAEVDLTQVDPALRMLLFTDGTVTRTLEAQTLSSVSVEVVSQDPVPAPAAVAPHLSIASGRGAVRRRVKIGAGEPLAPVIWAESHIVPSRLPDDFLDVLGAASDGIGGSLQQVQLECWREMLWFGFDRVPGWTGVDTAGNRTAITRLYRMIARGRPVLLISETFTVRRCAGKYYLDLPVDQTEPNSSSIN